MGSHVMAEPNDKLISDSYRELQSRLHADSDAYGKASAAFAPQIAKLVERLNPASLLDYGAGKQRLRGELECRLETMPPYRAYDPAIEAIAAAPGPADLVVCVDVLEHIEPDLLDHVLADLARVVEKHGFFTIATGPAGKFLADGRNAHLIQQPMEWWLPKLWAHFRTPAVNEVVGAFWVLVRPRDG